MARALELFAVQPGGTLAANAPLMLHQRLAEMLSFAAHVHDAENVTDLHDMRIAAKRLRYTLEIFAPAFDEEQEIPFAALIATVKALQEQLGEIHDCDVRVERIELYLRKHAGRHPEIRSGLQSLVQREKNKRSELYVRFEQDWQRLNGERQFEQQFFSVVLQARLAGIKAVSPRRAHAKTTAS